MLKSLDFSVIFVNYNSSADLKKAAVSFIKVHQQKTTYELIFVDNCSREDQADALRAIVEDLQKIIPVKAYFLSRNRGFGAANNYAAARARGEKLLFINPDTQIVQPLLLRLKRDLGKTNTGIVAPRLLLPDQTPQADAYGSFPTLESIWRAKWQHNRTEQDIKSDSSQGGLVSVDWVSGACLAMTRTHWQKIGGFDTHFFMYFEDVDLCRRAHEQGWVNYVDTQLKIIHFGGARRAVSRWRRRHYFTSQDQFFRFWRPRELFWLRLSRLPYQWYCYFTDPQ